MQSLRFRHRHFLFLPVLACIMLLPGLFSGAPLQAALAPVASSDAPFVTRDGMQVLPEDGAQLLVTDSSVSLVHGSTLMTGEGLLRVRIDDSTEVLGMNGAMHVSHFGDTLSVAALTSPVAVLVGTGRQLLPTGTQWQMNMNSTVLLPWEVGAEHWLSVRHLAPIPAPFQRKALSQVQSAEVVHAQAASPAIALFTVPQALHAFLLPAAAVRAEQSSLAALVASIADAVLRSDGQMARDAVAALPADTLSWDRSLQAHLALLLAQADSAAVATPLVEALAAADPDLWILLSVHEDYRSLTWTFADVPESTEHRFLSLLTLPGNDTAPVPVAAPAVARWHGTVLALLRNDEPAGIAVIDVAVHAVRSLQNQGYPERASRWSVELMLLADSCPLPDDLASSVQSLRTSSDTPLPVFVPQEETAVPRMEERSSVEQVALFQEDPMTKERVLQIMADAGALVTTETDAMLLPDGTVRVTRLVFSGSNADRTFTFLYHPDTGNVSQVQEGSRQYPNVLTLHAFAAWARGE